MNIILDLVLLGIIALCIFNGYRKGLILGISGILALVIAFYGANLVAETYSGEFSVILEPFVSGLVDSAVDKASEERYSISSGDDDESKASEGTISNNRADVVNLKDLSEDEVYDLSHDALQKLGFLKSAAANLAGQLKLEVLSAGHELKAAMVGKLTSTISYVLLLIIVFLLILIIFTVIANIINLAFKLPGLDLVNDIGGALFGLVKGLVFVFAIAWALRFFGFVLPASTVDKTLILGWLMEDNPLNSIFGM